MAQKMNADQERLSEKVSAVLGRAIAECVERRPLNPCKFVAAILQNESGYTRQAVREQRISRAPERNGCPSRREIAFLKPLGGREQVKTHIRVTDFDVATKCGQHVSSGLCASCNW